MQFLFIFFAQIGIPGRASIIEVGLNKGMAQHSTQRAVKKFVFAIKKFESTVYFTKYFCYHRFSREVLVQLTFFLEPKMIDFVFSSPK